MKKTREEIKTWVVDFVVETTEHTTETVENSTSLEGLGFDSLDFIEMAMSMEQEFDIEIPDGDAETWKTISDVVGYVESKQENL